MELGEEMVHQVATDSESLVSLTTLTNRIWIVFNLFCLFSLHTSQDLKIKPEEERLNLGEQNNPPCQTDEC